MEHRIGLARLARPRAGIHATVGHSQESVLCPWVARAVEGFRQSVIQEMSLPGWPNCPEQQPE